MQWNHSELDLKMKLLTEVMDIHKASCLSSRRDVLWVALFRELYLRSVGTFCAGKLMQE
jgi:hypothetical protein